VFCVGSGVKSKFLFLLCVLCLVSAGVLGFGVLFGRAVSGQPVRLDVVNVDTGLTYFGVQEAINAAQTLNGHRIQVGWSVFREHVVVNKSVSLEGEGPYASIIDGTGGLVVVDVVCDGVKISNLGIRNGVIGLRLNEADNCAIVDNVLYDGVYGIRLHNSRNSWVAGNHVSHYSHFGIDLDFSGNSTLRNNVMVNNMYNFGVDGMSLLDFLNDIDVSNTVNGKAVHYLVNECDVSIGPSSFESVGYLAVVNSSNVRVLDMDVQNNIQGLLCAFTSNLSICDVNAGNNWNGVHVVYSPNASVTGVKANRNFDYGIKLFGCSGSKVFQNNVDNNGWSGIGLFWSPNSILDLNEASYATYDLHLVFTNNSVISRNTALVKPSGLSIAAYYSHGNLIYRNTFENSLLFAETRNGTTFTPTNSWDDGVEGNYWSPYEGSDIDRDGIGDIVYVVGENNVDDHPLMGQFSEFSVILNEKVYTFSVVSNSTISEFQFDLAERRVSFSAIGQGATEGFCRITVLVGFLEELEAGDLVFLVNEHEPVLGRKWGSEAYANWYLSFANRAAQDSGLPWFLLAAVLVLLVGFGLVAVFSWRQRKRFRV